MKKTKKKKKRVSRFAFFAKRISFVPRVFRSMHALTLLSHYTKVNTLGTISYLLHNTIVVIAIKEINNEKCESLIIVRDAHQYILFAQ